jgi:kynurenine formamidase
MTDPHGGAMESIPEWIRTLASTTRRESDDVRLGTLKRIDDSARLRGAASIVEGKSLSLARTIELDGEGGQGSEEYLRVTFKQTGEISISGDELKIKPHGLTTTHIDAPNHIRVAQESFGQWQSHAPSLWDWSESGIVTRAIYLNIASVRGRDFVDPERPVTSDDLDRALEDAGTHIEPGDALLVDMGRDSFEAAGNVLMGLSTTTPDRPGIGQDGARWLSEHRPSVLCWDFVDAYVGGPRMAYVHLLIWAMGLALIDNCDFRSIRGILATRREKVGMLVAAPLAIRGASASPINPLLIV